MWNEAKCCEAKLCSLGQRLYSCYCFSLCKRSKKIKIKKEKDAAFYGYIHSWFSAWWCASKCFCRSRNLKKNSWWVSLNPINQACVSVGVELKKKTPVSRDLCRMQLTFASGSRLWAAPLSLSQLGLRRAFLFQGYRVVNSLQWIPLKPAGSRQWRRIIYFSFPLLSRTIKGGRSLVILMNANSKNRHADSRSKRTRMNKTLAYSDGMQAVYLQNWPREKHSSYEWREGSSIF